MPLTVHTADVLEAKLTGKPELAVAARAAGAVPKTWLPGDVKLINWNTLLTVNEPETVGAAA